MVKIISESSVAAGVRRIEAYTGARVEEMLDTIQDTLSDLKALFKQCSRPWCGHSQVYRRKRRTEKQVEDFMKRKRSCRQKNAC